MRFTVKLLMVCFTKVKRKMVLHGLLLFFPRKTDFIFKKSSVHVKSVFFQESGQIKQNIIHVYTSVWWLQNHDNRMIPQISVHCAILYQAWRKEGSSFM